MTGVYASIHLAIFNIIMIMTEQYAGKLLLDYVKWAEDENANLNDCPFSPDEVFEAMKMGGEKLLTFGPNQLSSIDRN